MNKFKKILTSTALAAVMAVSISVGAVAEEIESDITAAASDMSIESESSLYADTDEYFVLIADDGTVSTLPKDADGNVTVELNGVETVLSETEFLELRKAVEKEELLCGYKEQTDGGLNGKVTIYYGVFTITRNPIGNVFQNYYGVFAKIDNGDDITADLTIKATFASSNEHRTIDNSKYANSVYVEIFDFDFLNVQATVTSESAAFGAFEKKFGYNFT